MKMSFSKAIQILIRHTESDVRGSGVGIRSLPSDKEKENARVAIQRVWKRAFGYELSNEEAQKLF